MHISNLYYVLHFITFLTILEYFVRAKAQAMLYIMYCCYCQCVRLRALFRGDFILFIRLAPFGSNLETISSYFIHIIFIFEQFEPTHPEHMPC